MPEERVVKRVYKWKPMLTRPLGIPKNKWVDDITNDIKKLKIKKWTSCIQDRKKWKLYAEKPKYSKNKVVAPKEEEDLFRCIMGIKINKINPTRTQLQRILLETSRRPYFYRSKHSKLSKLIRLNVSTSRGFP
jgi:hypothetical protein